MTDLRRIRTVFTGVAGTPWYSNLYFTWVSGTEATALAEVDIDLVDEVNKKRKEQKLYSDVFSPPVAPGTAMPGDGNSTGNPAADGRIGGGNSNGGGSNVQSFNSSPKNGKGDEK